jgi:hypothetical protein
MRIEIRTKFKLINGKFLSDEKLLRMPYISISLDGSTIVEDCLIDTGASISIFGKKWKNYFDKINPIDKFTVQYGSGKRTLNIYLVKIEIQGYVFESKICYNPEKIDTWLGHIDF